MSLQQGIANIRERIRNFSISGSSEASVEVKDPRRRSKQHAIPMSPYQKYGPVVWDNPRRREKEKQRIREERQRAKLKAEALKQGKVGTGKMPEAKDKRRSEPPPLVTNFHNGQKQLLTALDDTKLKLKKTNSEKRREALKKSIQLIGPADQFPDGRVNHWI